jgi:hypothetical protein
VEQIGHVCLRLFMFVVPFASPYSQDASAGRVSSELPAGPCLPSRTHRLAGSPASSRPGSQQKTDSDVCDSNTSHEEHIGRSLLSSISMKQIC